MNNEKLVVDYITKIFPKGTNNFLKFPSGKFKKLLTGCDKQKLIQAFAESGIKIEFPFEHDCQDISAITYEYLFTRIN